jgi:hypothetical protein
MTASEIANHNTTCRAREEGRLVMEMGCGRAVKDIPHRIQIPFPEPPFGVVFG